jgi:hypothetical protein
MFRGLFSVAAGSINKVDVAINDAPSEYRLARRLHFPRDTVKIVVMPTLARQRRLENANKMFPTRLMLRSQRHLRDVIIARNCDNWPHAADPSKLLRAAVFIFYI